MTKNETIAKIADLRRLRDSAIQRVARYRDRTDPMWSRHRESLADSTMDDAHALHAQANELQADLLHAQRLEAALVSPVYQVGGCRICEEYGCSCDY